MLGPSVVKISRDGSKEVVDQIMPPGQGRDKEFHNHLLYDFQAHKLYVRVLSDANGACGVQDYADPAAPAEFDVISGADALLKDLTGGNGQTKQLGTAAVNGIATKVVEFTSAQGHGKIWVTQNGGFPVKIVIIGADGKETTLIEVKQLSFSKPPASAFILPEGCAEAARAAIGKPTTNVTAVTLQKIGNYTGACPAHLKMVGTITVDGPGTVFYQFGAGAYDPGQSLTFSAAGTKTVNHVMTLSPKYGNNMGGSALLQAIAEDSEGKHGIPTQSSSNADFNITCTSGGGK
jgi:hypothetical protein